MMAYKRVATAAATGGVTLVELVVVILLVGILAVYGLPRMLTSSGFSEVAYRDQLLSLLRLTQIQAMNRSDECHLLLFSGVQFGIPRRSLASKGCDASLPGAGEQYAAPHLGLTQQEAASLRLTLGNAPTRLDFDTWGRPLLNGSATALATTYRIGVQGESTLGLCLEPEGYLHACG